MKKTLLILSMLVAFGAWAQKPNIAPDATITGDGTGGGGCRPVGSAPPGCTSLNDLDFGTCGSQQMWISTSTPPSSTIGADYIEWNWPNPVAFDEMTIHHADAGGRFLAGFLIQYWDGTGWVNGPTISGLPMQCVNNITFQRILTDRMRITQWVPGPSGQQSNMNFREIEIFQASTSNDDAGVVSTNTVPAVCPGSFPVEVTVQNFGLNQIDSVEVHWEMDGVPQPTVMYNTLIDTIGGMGSSNALVNLGNFTFAPNTIYTLKAWTALPNNAADTVNFNDTLNAQIGLGEPTGLMASNVTAQSADINWDPITGTSFGVIYGPLGFNPATGGTTILPATAPLTLTGLTPTTAYDFYVFADCGGSVYSDTAGPVSFNTLIQGPQGVVCTSNPGPVAVLSEEFDTQGGWTGDISTSTGDWQINSGGTGSSGTGPSGAHSGSNYIYFEASGAGPAAMVSPAINLSTAMEQAELAFWMHIYGGDVGYLMIRVSTVSASGPFTDTVFYYNQGQLQTSHSDPWQQVGVNLDAYLGQSIWLEFEADRSGSFESDFAIDLVTVETCGDICVNPSTLSATNITGNSADISWTENGTATQWDIEYGPTGFTPTGTPTQAGVTSNPISLTGLTPNTTYDFYVRSLCGGAAGNSSWVGPLTFATALQGPIGVTCTSAPGPINIFADDFEVQSGWTGDIGTSSGQWQYNSGTTGSGSTGPSGAHSGNQYVYFEASGNGPASLISPAIDLTSAVDAAELAFWMHAYGASTGYLRVMVSTTSATGPFTDTVFNYTSGQLQTSSSDPWQHVGVDLSAYLGQTIYLEFEANRASTFTSDISLDLVTIATCGNICVDPSSLSLDSVTENSAYLDWTENGTATQWDIEFGPAGFTPTGTATHPGVTAKPFLISGLSAASSYDFYVRAVCGGAAGNSNWVGPFNFGTLIQGPQGVTCVPSTDTSTVILTEEFDSQGGWTGNISNSSGDWQFNSGTTGSSNTGPSGAHSGSNYIYFEASGSGPASLISPAINLVYAQDGAELAFWLHAYGEHVGYLNVTVSTFSDQGPWTDTVFHYNGQVQTASSDPWQHVGVSLDNYLGQRIWLKFEADRTTSFSGDIALDLLTIEACGTFCLPEIYSVNSVVPGATTASVVVDTSSDPVELEWGPCGFTQGTGTFISGTGNSPMNITGLNPNSCYEFYVRRSCGASGFSGWGGPFQFTTECILIAPFTEDFEMGFNPGDFGPNISQCFSSDRTSDPNWEVEDATGSNENSSNTGPHYDKTQFGTPGGHYLYMETSGGSTGDADTLRTAFIDVSALTAPYLSFSYHMYGSGMGQLEVDVWNGSNWDSVITIVGQQQTAGDDPWIFFGDSLTGLTSDTIQIRFTGVKGTGFTSDMSIDDIRVSEPILCPLPSGLSVASTGLDSTEVTWITAGLAAGTTFEVEYGPYGYTPGTGTIIATTNDSIKLPNSGVSNLCQEVYLRAICISNDTSLWVGPISACPTPEPCDSLEQYAPGLIQGQSALFLGWDGNGGDAEVSTAQANSGSNSLHIYDSGPDGFSDIVALLDSSRTTGRHNIEFAFYIPTGDGGYYNILHDYTGPTNVWAIEVYLDASGVATVDMGTNATGTIGTYAFNVAAWNTVEHIIDLDADTAWIMVNGVDVNLGWQWSLGSSNMGDRFNAVNFYSAANAGQSPNVYFDDFCVSPYVPFAVDAELQMIDVAGACGDSATAVYAQIRNLGGDTLKSAIVDVVVSGGVTATLSGTYTGSLATLQTDSVYVGTINTYAGASSVFLDGTVTVTGDGDPSNDSASAGAFSFIPYVPQVYSGQTVCATGDSVTLAAVSYEGASYAWFPNMTDTVPFAVSDSVDVPVSGASTYYVQYLASGSDSLTTTFAAGNSQSGNMFDIKALSPLDIQGFTVNPTSGGAKTIEVYYKTGSYVGHETSASSWTMVASVGINPASAGPVYFDLPSSLFLPGGGADYAFYIAATTGSLSYTNGSTEGALFASNADIEFYEGVGKSHPFGSTFRPRIWNGRIHYGSGDACSQVRVPVNFTVGADTNATASFTATGTGSSWNFDASASANADIYSWDFGDMNTGLGVNASHTYAVNGTYLVTLTVQDTTGCPSMDIDTMTVVVAGVVCSPPTGVAAGNTGCDSVEISWTSNTGGSIIQFGPTGFTPGQGTFTGVVTSPYSITGLTPGTAYDVWVADTCNGDTTAFAGPVSLTTASGPLPVASINLLTDSISGGTHYFAFDASGSSGATSYSWDFDNGSTSADTLTLASYTTPGNFTVVLTATNACGTDTDTMVITSTVGIEENALGRSLSVYPNPTQSDVTVEFDPQGSSDAVLRLMDIRGREIIRSEYDNLNGRFREELSLNGLAKGIYMIEIRSGDMRAYRRVNLQ